MADDTAKRPRGGLMLIGPLAILLVIAGFLTATLLSRKSTPALNATNSAPVQTEPAPAGPPPAAKALTKADLVELGRKAGSDYAGGSPVREALRNAVGRQFEMTIPVGCGGPDAALDGLGVSETINLSRKSLTLSATPVSWLTAPALQSVEKPEALESANGFWMPRPWTDSENCASPPAGAITANPTPSATPTLGLVEVMRSGSSRVEQRSSRPFQFVRKLPEANPESLIHPYRLHLSGRISAFSNGAPVSCWAETPDHRPVCLIAVDFERVAFVDPASGNTLAEWPG